MKFVEKKWKICFYFRLRKYRKMFNFNISLSDTRLIWKNYEKQNHSAIQTVPDKKKM